MRPLDANVDVLASILLWSVYDLKRSTGQVTMFMVTSLEPWMVYKHLNGTSAQPCTTVFRYCTPLRGSKDTRSLANGNALLQDTESIYAYRVTLFSFFGVSASSTFPVDRSP